MMSDSLMKRVLEFQREIEAKKAKPSIECFCYICGGAATGQRIVKASTFYSEGDQLENVVDSLFEDRCDCPRGRFRVSVCPESNREFCPNSRYFKDISQNDMCHYATCESRKGYDQKLILLQDTKWLQNVRMLSHYGERTPDANAEDLQSDTLLTPIGRVHYDREDGPWKFCPSIGCDFIRSQGYLVHDPCLQVLSRVHEAVVGAARPLDLSEVLLVFEVTGKERDSKDYNWGFGNAFDGPSCQHHRLDEQYWNPVENTEWTVVNPQRKVDLRPLVNAALETSQKGLSFNIKCDKKVGSGLDAKVHSDALSAIPTEVRLLILEMLPTQSVLNVFLASSAFRELSMNLPQTFWRSRMLIDAPWCGGEALAEVLPLAEVLRQETSAYPFHKLVRLIRETSAPGGGKLDDSDCLVDFAKDSMTLRNRRRIWINSEKIIREIETRHAAVRPVTGIVSTQMRKLASRCTIFISRDLGDMPQAASTVYFVPDIVKKSHLNKITAYFGADSQIVGVEFLLLDELSARLFGNRGELTSQITLDSPKVILGLCLSFGSPALNKKERRIRGIGFITHDSLSKPAYVLGNLDDGDIVQVLRVRSGQEVVGIAGEFSDQTITTFSMIIADQYLRPIHAHGPPGIDFTQHTQWIGRHPPLDWPREKYYLENRRNGAHNRFPLLDNPFPRVLEPPVYFVNLSGRQLSQIQAYGDSANIEAYKRTMKGLVFNFADDSTERVCENSNFQEIAMASTHTIQFEVRQHEEIVDMVLFAAYKAPLDGYQSKLCGIEFITSLGRVLPLGCVETSEHVRREMLPPTYSDFPEFGGVCGIQIALGSGAVETVALALFYA